MFAVETLETKVLLSAQTFTESLGETENTGSGESFDNRQESLGLNYVIALQGIFPSRDLTQPGASSELEPLPDTNGEPFLGEIRLFAGNFAPRGFAFANGQLLPVAQNTALFSLLGTTYGGNGTTTFALPDLRGRVAIGAGEGPGLENYRLGQRGGEVDTALTEGNLPSHSHTIPGGEFTDAVGNGDEFTNQQPYLAINYIVKLQGPADELGEIEMFAGNYAPRGYALAEGQVLNIADNLALFSSIGTTYGGDGVTTFALPDLRGRVPVGAGANGGSATITLGQQFGSENNVMTQATMPSHSHDFMGALTNPTGGNFLGANPISNAQASLGVHFAINTVGVFPSRSLRTGPEASNSGNDLMAFVELYANAHQDCVQANGQLLQITDNSALFSLLGTIYGGDGENNFALPDMRGRAVVGSGGGSAGPGLDPVQAGAVVGSDFLGLTAQHLPAHNHNVFRNVTREVDDIGVFRNGNWQLDADGSGIYTDTSSGDLYRYFGSPSQPDVPVVGDWNGDGVDEIGVYRGNVFYLDTNGNGQFDGAAGGDSVITYGVVGDTPIIGDWDGDGTDEIGVHRFRINNGLTESRFYLDANGNGVWDNPMDDIYVNFGIANDTPLAGDWNGDGTDSVGVHRFVTVGGVVESRFYLDANGDGTWSGLGAGADLFHKYGVAGDRPVIGDWNGDGTDNIGVMREVTVGMTTENRIYLDADGSGTWGQNGFLTGGDRFLRFPVGDDVPVVGKWIGASLDA